MCSPFHSPPPVQTAPARKLSETSILPTLELAAHNVKGGLCTQTNKRSVSVQQDQKDQPFYPLGGSRCVNLPGRCGPMSLRWGGGVRITWLKNKDHMVKAPYSIGPSNTSEEVKGRGQAGGRRGVIVHLLADTSVGGAKTNSTKDLSVKRADSPHAGPGGPRGAVLAWLCSLLPPTRGR